MSCNFELNRGWKVVWNYTAVVPRRQMYLVSSCLRDVGRGFVVCARSTQ